MAHDVRIAISCPDRTGLLSALAGRLFDLGADMGDASFAVLGEVAEFTAVVRLPDALSAPDARGALAELPELDGAEIAVSPFALEAARGENARVTHRIEVCGADRPGLVARLTEAFADYGANIVRMDCERAAGGPSQDYLIRIEAWIPDARAPACLAAVDNTAQSLGLASASEAI